MTAYATRAAAVASLLADLDNALNSHAAAQREHRRDIAFVTELEYVMRDLESAVRVLGGAVTTVRGDDR